VRVLITHRYNIFFHLERQRILEELSRPGDPSFRGPLTRPHGKISFEELARAVGKKWKSIDPSEKARLVRMAKRHKARYEEELAEWKRKKKQLEEGLMGTGQSSRSGQSSPRSEGASSVESGRVDCFDDRKVPAGGDDPMDERKKKNVDDSEGNSPHDANLFMIERGCPPLERSWEKAAAPHMPSPKGEDTKCMADFRHEASPSRFTDTKMAAVRNPAETGTRFNATYETEKVAQWTDPFGLQDESAAIHEFIVAPRHHTQTELDNYVEACQGRVEASPAARYPAVRSTLAGGQGLNDAQTSTTRSLSHLAGSLDEDDCLNLFLDMFSG